MGERELIGLIGFLSLFGLLALRVPVGLAMILVGITGNYALSLVAPFLRFEPYLRQFKTLLWNTVASYDLSVVPLFILMGFLASEANLSRDLFQGIRAMIGRLRGGVAMAAVGACGCFGAVCGSSLATAATMGRVALPELKAMRYSPRLSTGVLAAGGTLGILIPPSVALVLYATVVEASIIEMFQAAIVPGILAMAFFVIVVAVYVRVLPQSAPPAEAMAGPAVRRAIWRLIPVLLIFGAIILGLGAGLYTPTPAAAIGVFAILAYAVALRLITGEGLTWRGFKAALLNTAVISGMIYFILFGAEVLETFFARSNLPAMLADSVLASGIEPWTLLIVVLLLLIVLGMFMESLSMILVVVPFLWPALEAINGGAFVGAVDAAFGMTTDDLKVWFGILALIVVELGLITPPVGLNVFIISSLSKDVAMRDTFIGVMPFFCVELIRVALILAVPVLALGLPAWLS